MKIFLALCVSFLIISGCGKKSEPKYQGKIEQLEIIL
jgi:hypothetical protein